jgi:hypothetical protein
MQADITLKQGTPQDSPRRLACHGIDPEADDERRVTGYAAAASPLGASRAHQALDTSPLLLSRYC